MIFSIFVDNALILGTLIFCRFDVSILVKLDLFCHVRRIFLPVLATFGKFCHSHKPQLWHSCWQKPGIPQPRGCHCPMSYLRSHQNLERSQPVKKINIYFLSERRHNDSFLVFSLHLRQMSWTELAKFCLFVCLLLETFGRFWNLLENGRIVWNWVEFEFYLMKNLCCKQVIPVMEFQSRWYKIK